MPKAKKTTESKSSPSGETNVGKKTRKLEGVVVSDKMKDTCVVLVERFIKVPKYEKFMLRSKKYKAHDVGNSKKIGDKAVILECAPISKDKHFKVIA